MSCCRNGCTPIHYGVTNFTVSSVSISVFSTGCSLIVNCSCVVGMTAVPCVPISFSSIGQGDICIGSPHFRPNADVLTGECVNSAVGKCNTALINDKIDCNRPCFFTFFKCCIIPCFIAYSYRVIQCPHTYGDRNESRFACCGYFAGTGDCKRGNIFCCICACHRPDCLKAFGNLHMIKLPLAHIVEIQRHFYRLNCGNVVCYNINILNRIEKHFVCCTIVCNYLDSGRFIAFCLNVHLTNNRGIVALVIADREFNGMLTVAQNSTLVHGDNTACVSACNFIAVYICFCCGNIQSGCIIFFSVFCNLSCKIYGVICNCGDLSFSNCSCIRHCRSTVVHFTENRRLTVINCIRVVYSNIVNIEGIISVYIAVLSGILILQSNISCRSIAGAVGNIELHEIVSVADDCTFVGAQVNG